MSAFRLVQISDTHLSPTHAYFQDNWDVFVDEMAEEKPDMVLVTGDLCLNGPIRKADFAYAREQMERLPVPWRAIPGNHDAGETPPDARLGKPITDERRAIYGQADGVTEMNEWDLVAPPEGEKPGKVKLNKTYTMKRGDAYVYNEKELHSPSRDSPTKLIRIEGTNLDFVKRDRFEPVDNAAAAE